MENSGRGFPWLDVLQKTAWLDDIMKNFTFLWFLSPNEWFDTHDMKKYFKHFKSLTPFWPHVTLTGKLLSTLKCVKIVLTSTDFKTNNNSISPKMALEFYSLQFCLYPIVYMAVIQEEYSFSFLPAVDR